MFRKTKNKSKAAEKLINSTLFAKQNEMGRIVINFQPFYGFLINLKVDESKKAINSTPFSMKDNNKNELL